MGRAEVMARHPDYRWLSFDDQAGLDKFLREMNWLAPEERLEGVSSPGAGNMNLTLRVTTNRRSFIVKQARPWVEKYDFIAAPWNRMGYEKLFYERITSIPSLANHMPAFLGYDPNSQTICLEDIVASRDLTQLYAGERIEEIDLLTLAEFLASLHGATLGTIGAEFDNLEMRGLNHQHIFLIPFDQSNGLDLEAYEAGLTDWTRRNLQSDERLQSLVRSAGDRYLSAGRCLLHGDFFPGSWLKSDAGVFVIDPEFCFRGDPEFDLGVAIAHLALACRPSQEAGLFLSSYRGKGNNLVIDEGLLARYAGIEVIRRLVGVAQLPIPKDRSRIHLLEPAKQAVMTSQWEILFK